MPTLSRSASSTTGGVMLADIALRRKDYDEPSLFVSDGRYGSVNWGAVATLAASIGRHRAMQLVLLQDAEQLLEHDCEAISDSERPR